MNDIQPRALIVTAYGLYARSGGRPAGAGWLPVSGLVRLLAELDVDEPAVRSAISRLKRRGVIEPGRREGVAGYELSAAGREILREGDERIFTPPTARLDDGWLLAVFSVPESERAKRHTLRSRLAALGFGTAAPGVWIAPAHRYPAARAVLDRLDLAPYVDLFRSDYLAFGDLTTAVKHWWDLDAVRDAYDRFLHGWSRPADQRHPHPGRELGDWMRLVTDWRRLPYLDPGLPAELLPVDWPGSRAVDLFHRLRAQLETPAERQARDLL
jgi:phenylacetic acid degradation operon negative regulatory protein